MNEIQLVFNELFYGSGSWLGLLLFLTIITVLAIRQKFLGALMIPVSVFLGINYINYDPINLGWHAIIMFLSGVFIMINIIKKQ